MMTTFIIGNFHVLGFHMELKKSHNEECREFGLAVHLIYSECWKGIKAETRIRGVT